VFHVLSTIGNHETSQVSTVQRVPARRAAPPDFIAPNLRPPNNTHVNSHDYRI